VEEIRHAFGANQTPSGFWVYSIQIEGRAYEDRSWIGLGCFYTAGFGLSACFRPDEATWGFCGPMGCLNPAATGSSGNPM